MKVLFIASGNKSNVPKVIVKNQADSLTKIGVKIDYFLIKGKGGLGYLKNIYPLIKMIRSNNYNVLHSHYSLSAFVTTFALVFCRRRIPHIVSLMGSDTHLKGIHNFFVKFFNQYFWDATIVKSRNMMKDLMLSNCFIVPNGVNIERVIKIEKNIFNSLHKFTSTGDNVVLFAADPERKEKNFDLAKRAMASINAKLKVVYDKSYEELLYEIFSSDIVLLTSIWEGSPNIVKEAMACNIPVVSTKVGDVEWLFGNQPGYFLSDNDVEDIRNNIQRALAFKKKYECTNGRERIKKLGLCSVIIAKRIINIYESVIKK